MWTNFVPVTTSKLKNFYHGGHGVSRRQVAQHLRYIDGRHWNHVTRAAAAPTNRHPEYQRERRYCQPVFFAIFFSLK